MGVWFDGNFWNRHFSRIFVPQIDQFCDAIVNRVLPTFENIGEEAEAVANAEYERLGNLPVADDTYWDMADVAEQAFQAGLVYFEANTAVRQTMINLSLAALHHMFEQQLLLFHRKTLHPYEENDSNKISIRKLKERLRAGGVEIELLQSWSKIEELRLIANVIKHAEGRSADELRDLRPDLFTHPSLDEKWSSLGSSLQHVYLPLAGEDVYLNTDDLKLYQAELINFWQEFGEAIKNL